jgi:hypothetical protein
MENKEYVNKLREELEKKFISSFFDIKKQKKNELVFSKNSNGLYVEITWRWGKYYRSNFLTYSAKIIFQELLTILDEVNKHLNESHSEIGAWDVRDIEIFRFHDEALNGDKWEETFQYFSNDEEFQRLMDYLNNILSVAFIPLINRFGSLNSVIETFEIYENHPVCISKYFHGGGTWLSWRMIQLLFASFLFNSDKYDAVYQFIAKGAAEAISKLKIEDTDDGTGKMSVYTNILLRLKITDAFLKGKNK